MSLGVFVTVKIDRKKVQCSFCLLWTDHFEWTMARNGLSDVMVILSDNGPKYISGGRSTCGKCHLILPAAGVSPLVTSLLFWGEVINIQSQWERRKVC